MSDLVKVDENLILASAKDAKDLLALVKGLLVQDPESFAVASQLAVQVQTKLVFAAVDEAEGRA